MNREKKILALLSETGPITGFELWKTTGLDRMELWKTCMTSGHIQVLRTGVDYLRLDRRVEGYARLSPSVLRGFLTYSIVGLRGDPRTGEKTRQLESRIRKVSHAKKDMAFNIVSAVIETIDGGGWLAGRMCVIIAGDVVYGMAHDTPRPERSTGKKVNGSDMDLVFVTANDVPDKIRLRLDEAVYEEKIRLLAAPRLREEIDYVIKSVSEINEQVKFDTFSRMVACKILYEGEFLQGSRTIFDSIRMMLDKKGVSEQLRSMDLKARWFRENAESALLLPGADNMPDADRFLFYPVEESEEFEPAPFD